MLAFKNRPIRPFQSMTATMFRHAKHSHAIEDAVDINFLTA